MKHQLLIEVDGGLWKAIERVAPARSRRRSEFIRMAIRKAVMEEQERLTEAAYRKQPDTEPTYFNSEVWEPTFKPARRRRSRAKK